MTKERKSYEAEFKLRAVMESFQRDTTIEAVCRKHQISYSMLDRWRKKFREKAAEIFGDQRNPASRARAKGYAPGESPDDLKRLIGHLAVENDILKIASGLLGLK